MVGEEAKGNSKSEIRISKQIQMFKRTEELKRKELQRFETCLFGTSILFRISSFEFRLFNLVADLAIRASNLRWMVG